MNDKFLQAPYYNLYFVRHGQSIGNYFHIFGGWMDLPLTEDGKQELQELKTQIPYPEADLYRHSGLTRARDTLQIITGQEKSALQDWRFSESYFGLMEGTVPEDYEVNEDFYDKFYHDIPQGAGEELFSEQRDRVQKGCKDLLAELKEKGLNSAYIFGHYGTIKSALFSYVPGLSHNLESKEIIPNGSLWHFLFIDQEADQPGCEMRCLMVRSYWNQEYNNLDYQAEGFEEAEATLLT